MERKEIFEKYIGSRTERSEKAAFFIEMGGKTI